MQRNSMKTNDRGLKKATGNPLVAVAAFTITLLAGCATTPAPEIPEEARNADDLLIIDCLLPGQVRRLGSYSTYLTARRPIKTTASDCEIRGGEYVAFDRADYATALKMWLPLADAGDPEAQTYVGEIFEKGLGIKPDYTTAASWYRKAAEQGFSRAQINLGNLYEKGWGVPKDKAIALNWYRRASGVQDDDLQYASSVEITSEAQKELDALREEVAFKNRQLEDLRSQLASTQRQLKDRKSALLAAEKARHEKEKALIAQQSKAIHEQSKALIEQLKMELVKATAEVSQQQAELAKLNQEAETMSAKIASASDKVNNEQMLVAANVDAPSIEIIDPPMSLMRGTPTVRLRSGITEKEVVGKIKAPSGLKAFYVNGRQEPVDDYSLFWVTVPVKSVRNTVKLKAVDDQGREVEFDFSLVADQKPLDETVKVSQAAPLDIDRSVTLGRYHALIIGNNRYAYYPDLETPINDARETEKILREKYGFSTTVLTNATRYDILSALNDLRENLTAQDNLLIYYAGHGELDDANSRGYWLPVDAEPGNSANWISNVSVSDILNAMPAKHVMVVADSCYAGTLSMASVPRINVDMSPEAHAEWVKIMSKARARTVLTSGGVAPVLDGGGSGHSVFARAFIDTLNKADGIVEGHSVYREVLGKVRIRARELNHDQVPEYAPARYAGHEAGEFFFQSI
ncbi:MAG: caspase family protein [Ketobacteraceae bacterium]|nr:caspase family protein [Ketobacteraceae bacterium]